MWETLSAAILIDRKARQCTGTASLHSTLYHCYLPSIRLVIADHSSFFNHISSISDMSQSSSNSSFKDLFNAALQDYENKTGIKLVDDPLAKTFENCDSVDSITAIIQEQAQIFRKFKGDDGKLTRSLKASVDVLYTLSNTILGGGIGLVHPRSFIGVPCSLSSFNRHSLLQMRYSPASLSYLRYVPFSDPICVSHCIFLPQAVKDASASYDILVDLFASFERFLGRLSIYTRVPSTPALKNVLVEILVELLSALALATKQVKQGRLSEFFLAGKTLD